MLNIDAHRSIVNCAAPTRTLHICLQRISRTFTTHRQAPPLPLRSSSLARYSTGADQIDSQISIGFDASC
jgi:hypothetical protein